VVVIEGWEALDRVVMVDQSLLGRTPRSNPAVYIGAFDDLRELFADSEAARQRGFNAGAFSFNSRLGQCQRCRGAGFEKIEMQFLSDVFIRCPDCDGRRYRPHILECKMQKAEGKTPDEETQARERNALFHDPASAPAWSIADVLEATVDEVVSWLPGFGGSRHARRATEKLRLLQDVGLGYLRLGQPINTLSGGESQRLKLAAHLAEAGAGAPPAEPDLPEANPALRRPDPQIRNQKSEIRNPPPSLFLFDEPTTGLHFEDVRVLLGVFQRLVDAGHSVVVIEHNLEVIKCADWVIDLGPEAGDEGGRVVVTGTPEAVAACQPSHTGRALRAVVRFPLARRPARR
jgi:excinuclease ABC subunit A